MKLTSQEEYGLRCILSLARLEVGAAALAAEFGVWPGVWYGIGCGGGLILAGLLVASKMRKQGGYVPLDFFSSKYGERKWVRVWGWMSNIPSLLGIFVAQLMAAGSIMTIFGFGYTQGAVEHDGNGDDDDPG